MNQPRAKIFTVLTFYAYLTTVVYYTTSTLYRYSIKQNGTLNPFLNKCTICFIRNLILYSTSLLFYSKLFFNDFTVRIYEDCELDENTVLMIFCSYYNDKEYDASNN